MAGEIEKMLAANAPREAISVKIDLFENSQIPLITAIREAVHTQRHIQQFDEEKAKVMLGQLNAFLLDDDSAALNCMDENIDLFNGLFGEALSMQIDHLVKQFEFEKALQLVASAPQTK
jgi:hypothetical protein